jgi:hypothetical protein
MAAALSFDVKYVQLSGGDGTEVTSQACPRFLLPQPSFNGIGAPSVPEIFRGMFLVATIKRRRPRQRCKSNVQAALPCKGPASI